MGIYLPMALTLFIPLGAVIGWFYNRWAMKTANPDLAERLGMLAATGLIVGESLFGVIFAILAGVTNSATPMQILKDNPWADVAAMVVFFGGVAWIYRRVAGQAGRA
jgi:hypothetical protein